MHTSDFLASCQIRKCTPGEEKFEALVTDDRALAMEQALEYTLEISTSL